jgi:pyruvate,water dikinase
MKDVPHVGGKNASLGELIGALSSAGVRVPDGFATTSSAYRRFLRQGGLDEKIQNAITALDVNDTRALSQTAGEIREWVAQAPLPSDLESDIRAAYRQMENGTAAVAVRSSATAEDMPDASFAGQQETFLNICGEDAVIDAVRLVFASLFTDRAVSYRHHQGYDKQDVALSVAVQRMVRSDLAASGVMFTLDTESGFEEVVFITGAYGLGENVVQGSVNPDEFYVYKPSLRTGKNAIIRRQLGDKADKLLFGDSTCVGGSVKNVRVEEAARRRFCITDDDVNTLARYAMAIEAHYGRHMDIEWAKDGVSGDIFIVQARPETVKSRATVTTISRYRILTKGAALAEGRAIGQKIGVGTARIVAGTADMHRVEAGDVLIADMTDPDWEPVMKRAAGIVTRRGGRTCHAAIIARELGVPAIVGCGDTLAGIADGGAVSVSCAEGDTGHVYEGETKFVIDEFASDSGAQLPIKLQINVANPDLAFEFSRLPTDGVGLARLEFIIARTIGFHPRCALEYTELPADLRQEVRKLAVGYDSPRDCYVGKIAEGVATIAAAFHPRPVVVRLSDFKSNEYAGLVGGRRFEPIEENPMIGFRGAARYVDASFADCFALECEAMQRVREDMGIDNIWLMVPFVRTVNEAEAVVQKMRTLGISRDDWKIIMMCEVPANALLAEQFLDHFDGFSIGSNDLTQLTLALDRDSELVSGIFDERNLAVKMMISRAIQACREQNKYVGICGQAPSDYPDFAKWLMEEGISAISLNPDSVIEARIHLASKS